MEEIDNFKDKKGRLIKILTDEHMFCFAFFDKKEIGKFEYDTHDEYIYMSQIMV